MQRQVRQRISLDHEAVTADCFQRTPAIPQGIVRKCAALTRESLPPFSGWDATNYTHIYLMGIRSIQSCAVCPGCARHISDQPVSWPALSANRAAMITFH